MNSENSENWRNARRNGYSKQNQVIRVIQQCIKPDLLPEGSSNRDLLIHLRHIRLLPDFQKRG
ncbi:hypothetical protein PR048_015989 [Dryococelus australis]|uniref:Uncharacterized protein n=1 Tax=Dryococelus australis TaxID=614101 RepID=A0ABQ9HIH2_9NEOP|nr:hypothetical protein PR048_015989 [Dryococelus australis]